MPTCQFCALPSEYRCGWFLADKVVRLRPIAVEPGMLVRVGYGTIHATVLSIELSRPLGPSLVYAVRLEWKGKEYQWAAPSGNYLNVLEPGPCGALICYRHVREVSESRQYCIDHWNAWQGDQRIEEPRFDGSLQRAIDGQMLGSPAKRRAGRDADRRRDAELVR
jgi:hypothetical protein